MDIATYDREEDAARARVASWQLRRTFGPGTFEHVGFPTRIGHIGELRGVLAGMHKPERYSAFMDELDGLDKAEVVTVLKAMLRYIDWYRAVYPDQSVPVPVAEVISQYMAYNKLCGLPSRRRVLEVGAGLGFSATFVTGDDQIERYNFVEITQSLYVLQASLCARMFADRFRNHALTEGDTLPVGGLSTSLAEGLRTHRIESPRRFRCQLYPWWRVDEALDQEYDVIASHANLLEMHETAAAYYLQTWARALSADGYLLIQDTGHSLFNRNDALFKTMNRLGYRALVAAGGPTGVKPLFGFNLLLVHEGHRDYALAKPFEDGPVFVDEHPTVRSVFRLDKAPERRITADDLVRALGKQVAHTFGTAD